MMDVSMGVFIVGMRVPVVVCMIMMRVLHYAHCVFGGMAFHTCLTAASSRSFFPAHSGSPFRRCITLAAAHPAP